MQDGRDWRPIAAASLLVLGATLLGVIVGLIILGKHDAVQDSITGLATIGAGLSGGFAGWFAHGVAHHEQTDTTRSTSSR